MLLHDFSGFGGLSDGPDLCSFEPCWLALAHVGEATSNACFVVLEKRAFAGRMREQTVIEGAEISAARTRPHAHYSLIDVSNEFAFSMSLRRQ
jgi:hypothetical protein